MSELIVVGAGPSGLGCAIALAEESPRVVRLIDRTPVAGGEAGWSNPEVKALVRRAESAGVYLDLGITAIRWRDDYLLVSGPGRVETLAADQIFFAGGLRPSTAADLRLTGDRPAGVIAASVAEHLLTTGQHLWRTVVIIGDGPWAERSATEVRHQGGRVIAASHDDPEWADLVVPLPPTGVVIGRSHVTALRLGETEIPCDAIILSGGPIPNRNVDGALTDTDPNVTFAQPLRVLGVERRSHYGAQVAQGWLSKGGRK